MEPTAYRNITNSRVNISNSDGRTLKPARIQSYKTVETLTIVRLPATAGTDRH